MTQRRVQHPLARRAAVRSARADRAKLRGRPQHRKDPAGVRAWPLLNRSRPRSERSLLSAVALTVVAAAEPRLSERSVRLERRRREFRLPQRHARSVRQRARHSGRHVDRSAARRRPRTFAPTTAAGHSRIDVRIRTGAGGPAVELAQAPSFVKGQIADARVGRLARRSSSRRGGRCRSSGARTRRRHRVRLHGRRRHAARTRSGSATARMSFAATW